MNRLISIVAVFCLTGLLALPAFALPPQAPRQFLRHSHKPFALALKAVSRSTLLRFYQAIEKDDVAGVRKGLLRGMRVSELLPEFRQTPLMLAAESNSSRVFNFLLGKRADVHVRDADEKTALYYAVTVGTSGTQNGSLRKRETRRIAMIRALLSRGLSVNDRARNGDTPLMLLTRYNMTSSERYWRSTSLIFCLPHAQSDNTTFFAPDRVCVVYLYQSRLDCLEP